MQPAPKMLLLSSPVVLAGLFPFLSANSFFTLLAAILSMRAVIAVNIPCYIVLSNTANIFLTFLTKGEQ